MTRILIVDDTKAIHMYVKAILSASIEVQCTSVFDGDAACKLLTHHREFDLIFLDWEMPIQNGPETLISMKALDLDIPIIMMTSKNSPSDIEQALNLGAAEYMMKPFTVDIMLEKIETVTRRKLQYVS